MWTYIPILPSKYAWDNRLFTTAHSLKHILTQLHDKDSEHKKKYNGNRLVLPGMLYLRPAPLKDGEREPPAYRLTGPSFAFSGIQDLERVLKEEKVGGREITEEDIEQISFYSNGWWHKR